jgi:hypothetical protein
VIKSKEDEIGGTGSKHERHEECINILVGKPERKGRLGRSRRRQEDNIKMKLKE